MNVGIDIRCLMNKERTGVGEYTYGLLDAVFKIDRENEYYLFYNSWTDVFQNIPKWQQDNVHHIYTRWPNKLLNLLLFLKVLKLDNLVIKNCLKIKNFKLKIDIWFSPNLNFTHLSKHVKHLQTVHDLSFEFFPECFTWKQRLWHKFLNPKRQCRRADVILTPSENTRRDVVEKFQVSSFKFQILRPGISNFKFQIAECEMAGIKKKYNLPKKYILYLGTLEPRKNVKTIIEAYKLSVISYKLVIAGALGWKNKKLMIMIGQTEGVRYVGYVSEEDKPALYQGASLFVFPSLYEGFGLPVLEAMASRVPVITSNRSSMPEVAGDAAYLVNPHNVIEIAEAMKKILSDEKLRCLLIERGRKRAEAFNYENTARKFIKLLCV